MSPIRFINHIRRRWAPDRLAVALTHAAVRLSAKESRVLRCDIWSLIFVPFFITTLPAEKIKST